MIRFFEPGKSYLRIKDEVDKIIQDTLERGDLILRRDVDIFEENLARYVGTKYAVGVASGTDALILSLKALGITGKVLVPSYTFRATIEAVIHAGCTPILYDLGEQLNFLGIKAWIPAHIAGEVTATQEEFDRAAFNDVVVIEDACQAIGASPIRGVTACYSFYPAKILGCYGDGGAIATNDVELYRKLQIYRNHNKGDWKEVGYNSRLDNIQAAVLNVKLKYLPQDIARRKAIAEMYDEGLLGVELDTKREVYQDYIIRCEDRDELYDYLLERGVETMKNGYPFPEDTPKGINTIMFEDSTLRLPCNADITDDEVKYVIACVSNFYARV